MNMNMDELKNLLVKSKKKEKTNTMLMFGIMMAIAVITVVGVIMYLNNKCCDDEYCDCDADDDAYDDDFEVEDL